MNCLQQNIFLAGSRNLGARHFYDARSRCIITLRERDVFTGLIKVTCANLFHYRRAERRKIIHEQQHHRLLVATPSLRHEENFASVETKKRIGARHKSGPFDTRVYTSPGGRQFIRPKAHIAPRVRTCRLLLIAFNYSRRMRCRRGGWPLIGPLFARGAPGYVCVCVCTRGRLEYLSDSHFRSSLFLCGRDTRPRFIALDCLYIC